jgi:signal transduction histidine kinase
MMRPRQVWAVFGLCLLVLLGAVSWISLTALRLEAESRRQSALEENVRLALWRMDSALAPLVNRESGRPYFAYSAFYPAEQAFTNMFSPIEYGEVLVPSPLLSEPTPLVLLHFQFSDGGELSSPQVPVAELENAIQGGFVAKDRLSLFKQRLDAFCTAVSRDALLAQLSDDAVQPLGGTRGMIAGSAPPPQQAQVAEQSFGQQARNVMEQQKRAQQFAKQFNRIEPDLTLTSMRQGVMTPLWIGENLLLARRVMIDEREYVQGCWLDWSAIQRELLPEIADLFPSAVLTPARSGARVDASRSLVTLPVVLAPGPTTVAVASAASAVRWSLWVAWACVVVAAGAVLVLLVGTLALSERRAAFVSAVTHELRTPLTTFQLYTDLLADGQVRDADRQQRLLETLRLESRRLAHLVENVLTYARLERGTAGATIENLAIASLFDRVRLVLTPRAEQVGMSLSFDASPDVAGVAVRADVAGVERILANLVDNACKYASATPNCSVRVQATRTDGRAVVRVRDYGPGLTAAQARRLFQPFVKPGDNAAAGVGLGLALSRRLARSMGGELFLERPPDGGACFVLTLPIADRG